MNKQERDELIRRYAEAGLSMKEAAANIGQRYGTIYVRAKALGIEFKRGGVKRVPTARAVVMRDAYLAGRTLQDIAEEHGVTRERVRQIITKYFGRLRTEGGMSAQARVRRAQRLAARNTTSMKKWGCSYQQYKVLRDMRGPTRAFAQQRRNANERGIEWQLTLWEWWTIWQKSGKWTRRGRARGNFVMCRNNDVGPYRADNVFIALACENISTAVRKNSLPLGVYEHSQGYEARTNVGNKVVSLGVFGTPQEAHFAYLRSLHLEAA